MLSGEKCLQLHLVQFYILIPIFGFTDGVEAIKSSHLESQTRSKLSGRADRADWITVGLAFGMTMACTLDQIQAPLWVQFIFFLTSACMIQGFSRFTWKLKKKIPETPTAPPAESNPS